MLSELSRSQKNTNTVWFHSHEILSSQIRKDRKWNGGDQGWGSYCLIGIEFQFCKMKRVLEMVVGWLHSILGFVDYSPCLLP